MTGRGYAAPTSAGHSLRTLRRQLGLSRRQVAVHADVPSNLLRLVEGGKRGAPPSFYARVAVACIALSSARDIPRAEQPAEASTWP
ncbi:helix-turn-helix transcriptional regulator [Microbacterium sp. BWR-S6Y]|uniref:helix-turn-helix domain-containing protein n=1 Tax=Microbacterium sp. BWR-S6Y TaxID=3232073 RepID=UPI003529631F